MTTKENLKLQIEWFNYFADYIKQYDINLYNDERFKNNKKYPKTSFYYFLIIFANGNY